MKRSQQNKTGKNEKKKKERRHPFATSLSAAIGSGRQRHHSAAAVDGSQCVQPADGVANIGGVRTITFRRRLGPSRRRFPIVLVCVWGRCGAVKNVGYNRVETPTPPRMTEHFSTPRCFLQKSVAWFVHLHPAVVHLRRGGCRRPVKRVSRFRTHIILCGRDGSVTKTRTL